MRKGTGKSLLQVFGWLALVGLLLTGGPFAFAAGCRPVAEYLCDENGTCGAVEEVDELDESLERLWGCGP